MVYMPEIKANSKKVDLVLERLKQRTENLKTSHSNPEFSTSTLNFLNKITSIEKKYYQALSQYKATLLKIEADIQSKIETDENSAIQMVSKPTKL